LTALYHFALTDDHLPTVLKKTSLLKGYAYFRHSMTFQLQAHDPRSKARAGELTTAHGVVQTPIFMPVGTAGTVKAVHFSELKSQVHAQIILGNTYHLYLRPGLGVLGAAGGLHKFIGWDRPILTDSGGYQVYSLSDIRKIKEEGAEFRSHIDGSKHIFTPENVIDTQRKIGADIMMAFDECTPYPCEYDYAKKSMDMTHRWLDRCITRYNETQGLYGYDQLFFPIVQGSTYKDLRKQSAEYIASKGMEGNAIGGLSVGEPDEDMYEMTELVCDILPKDKPRYLMGVGTPANILEAIFLGIDMFDCVMPTRNARNGMLFTTQGIINIRNEKFKSDFSPIDEYGACDVSRTHTKAYLRHLMHSGEILGAMISSVNNLSFYLWLVGEARRHIIEGDFSVWKKATLVKVMTRL
jgi:queuine tRNA-ribosyltransferase